MSKVPSQEVADAVIVFGGTWHLVMGVIAASPRGPALGVGGLPSPEAVGRTSCAYSFMQEVVLECLVCVCVWAPWLLNVTQLPSLLGNTGSEEAGKPHSLSLPPGLCGFLYCTVVCPLPLGRYLALSRCWRKGCGTQAARLLASLRARPGFRVEASVVHTILEAGASVGCHCRPLGVT